MEHETALLRDAIVQFLQDRQILFRKLFAADLRFIGNLLLNHLESIADLQECLAFLRDLDASGLKEEQWKIFAARQHDGFEVLHINLILEVLELWFEKKKLAKCENFKRAVVNLFSEFRWQLDRFQHMLSSVNSNADLKRLTNVLNLIYAYGYDDTQLHLSSDSQNWEAYILAKLTKKVSRFR